MLNALNARGGAVSNATVGAVAIFAGDAQALSRTLAAGDRDDAPSALATLESDRDAVDSAVAASPGAFNLAEWNRIKAEMTALSKRLGRAGSSPHAASGAGASTKPASHSLTTSAKPEAEAPAVAAAAAPPTGAATLPATAAAPPSDTRITGGEPSDTIKARAASPPRVVIESRTAQDTGGVRIKGYIEGTGLKRGGVFAGSNELREFNVGGVAGEQRINFDIGFASPKRGEVLRVYDASGQMGQASILDDGFAASSAMTESSGVPPTGTATSDTPEIPPLASSANPLSESTALPPPSASSPSMDAPTSESGVDVYRNAGVSGSGSGEGGGVGGANTAEIPSHGTPRKSPSKRHTTSSHLGNAQVNITSANQTQITPPTYELAGQIRGKGISRAGIYVDGRLVKPITVETNTDATSFDVEFVAQGEGDIVVRAYGVGDQFVESTVKRAPAMASADSSANTSMSPGGSISGMPGGSAYDGSTYGGSSGPMIGNSSGIVVQIAAVGPITQNLYVVSGVISGRHLSGAGLYQNGMLVQAIAVGGGGIGGMLGSLIPGASHNVNFNVRFNPQAGPATIRAFDSSGGYSEQPVIISAINPYGIGVNPYGANPYGSNTYGSPGVGISPYRSNPYAGGSFGTSPVNPYMAPGNLPPASSSW